LRPIAVDSRSAALKGAGVITQRDDAAQIERLIHDWAAAVRRKDMVGILRHHANDIVMFDVPPPLHLRGIQAYRDSWQPFSTRRPIRRCSTSLT
jgi:ketosteroid isomerase-like protein